MIEQGIITIDNLVYEEISQLIYFKPRIIYKQGTKYTINDIVNDYNIDHYIKCIYYNYNLYYEDNYVKLFVLKKDAPILTHLENKNDLSVLIIVLKNYSDLGTIMSILDNHYKEILLFQKNNELYIDLSYNYIDYFSNLSHKIIIGLYKNFKSILNKNKNILKGDIEMKDEKLLFSKNEKGEQIATLIDEKGEKSVNLTNVCEGLSNIINNYIKIIEDGINKKSEDDIKVLVKIFLKTSLDTKSLESIYKDYLYFTKFNLDADQLVMVQSHMQCICYLAFNK